LASQLGYDVLFQDVDVLWYRNPLQYLRQVDGDDDVSTFDMYIQDDGDRSPVYAPKSSNAGFYFARNNAVTRAFFHAFLLAGDFVLHQGNDQKMFNSLLNEHASVYGLRVHTMSRNDDGFPAGWVYNRRKDYMKDLIAGKAKPFVFFYSWTANKTIKVQYMQQMGDWIVRDACVQTRANDLVHLAPLNETMRNVLEGDATLLKCCCLPAPVFRCHYRDKPSLIPCKDSQPFNPGFASFWD
jgi:hypothetical protein